jgi:hypothetical protein
MSIEGKWSLFVNAPNGKYEGFLVFETLNDTLTGKIITTMGEMALSDIRVDGNNLSWKGALKIPFPMTVQFNAVLKDDNNISGTAVAGMFGTSEISATRAS